MTSLIGCHITYVVRVNGTDLSGRMDLPCGHCRVFLKGRGKRYFSFWQVFYVKGDAIYYPDSLKVLINDIPLEAETYIKKHKIDLQLSELEVSDGDTVVSKFFVQDGVFEQDTIVVKTSGLLECNERLSGDIWFYYYFNRNEFIRIR